MYKRGTLTRNNADTMQMQEGKNAMDVERGGFLCVGGIFVPPDKKDE